MLARQFDYDPAGEVTSEDHHIALDRTLAENRVLLLLFCRVHQVEVIVAKEVSLEVEVRPAAGQRLVPLRSQLADSPQS